MWGFGALLAIGPDHVMQTLPGFSLDVPDVDEPEPDSLGRAPNCRSGFFRLA